MHSHHKGHLPQPAPRLQLCLLLLAQFFGLTFLATVLILDKNRDSLPYLAGKSVREPVHNYNVYLKFVLHRSHDLRPKCFSVLQMARARGG